MKQYHELLEKILKYGTEKGDRTCTGTISLFGPQMEFNLADGFPIVTTKKVSFKSIVVELLWFLRGDSNIKYLVNNGVNIWNEDAYNYYVKRCKQDNIIPVNFKQWEEATKTNMEWRDNLPNNYSLGDTGEQYPRLWRHWDHHTVYDEGIDQIDNLIQGLKNNPTSRRHILTAWNPATLDDMALHACHALVQFNCRPTNNTSGLHPHHADNLNEPKYYLDCKMYQRSADTMLGVPYNTASYALLTHILCQICNMIPGRLIHTFGDAHIYQNHIEAAKEQLERDPEKYELPTLKFDNQFKDWDINDVEEWVPEGFVLENYQHYPKLENSTKLNTGLK